MDLTYPGYPVGMSRSGCLGGRCHNWVHLAPGAACTAANIGENWTPRELRHSSVSLMSTSGVPVEEIARLAGHTSTRTTEIVYRRELRPIPNTGAEIMDIIFNPQPSPVN